MTLIEGLTSEHEEELKYEPEYEIELESGDFNLDQIVDSAVEWATTPIPLSLEPIDLPSTEYYPSSELKALLNHLKYVYLGEKEALSLTIASHLTEEQEEDLVVLRDNKEAIGWT